MQMLLVDFLLKKEKVLGNNTVIYSLSINNSCIFFEKNFKKML